MVFNPYAYDLAVARRQPPLPDEALVARVLPQMHPDARRILWRGLVAAAEGALTLWEQSPPGMKREPPPFLVQHVGKPYFNEADLRQQTLDGWHCLMGLELRLAAEALDALILVDADEYRPLLAEECVRVGQLYAEMKRRANEWVAQALLAWELHLLRYRGSSTLLALIYRE
jgi:hypothetical protein